MHVRCLNLLECHSKVLLQDHGVNIQKFKIVEDAQEVKSLKKNFSKFLIFYNRQYFEYLKHCQSPELPFIL